MALITSNLILDVALIIAAILLLCFLSLYLYMTRNFRYWPKRGVQEVKPIPFLGNFAKCFFLRESSGEFVKDIYEQFPEEPCVGFYIFDKPFLLVRDPNLIKQILVKDFQSFYDRYASAREEDRLGYANLFLIKNPAWRTVRQKLSPIYTSGKIKKLFLLMVDIGKNLDAHMESLNLKAPGKVMEIKDLAARITTDMIALTAFGLEAKSLENPDSIFRKYGKLVFEYNFFRSIEFLACFFMPSMMGLLRAEFFGKAPSNFFRKVFWQTLMDRMETNARRNDLVDFLAELKETHKNDNSLKGFRFDGDDLLAQAAVFFTGGFETSSTTMTFVLYELALHPEIQSKLRREIEDALLENDGEITFDLVNNLRYMHMVLSETLRKYPVVSFLDRVTNQEYKVPDSNLVLEKGTPVYIPLLGLHYDPAYFPEPQRFDPERFNEENKANIPSCAYIPFGDGPRMCIGMRLGLLQSKLGILILLRKWKFTPCKETIIPMRFNPRSLTVQCDGGLFLNIQRIEEETN